MHFLIETKLLYQALRKVVGIISGRPRLPILNHVLLEINENYLFITATDLEIEITVKVLLNNVCSNDFSITVSGRKLFSICSSISEYLKISVELKNNKLMINSGSSSFSLSTFSSVDFPKLESQKDVAELEISQIVLRKIIELTQFAMGNEDVRYYLNGIFFEVKNSIIRVVATDGHRLAVCSVFINRLSLFHTMIIPRKSICEILRLLSFEKKSLPISMRMNNHSVCLKINDYTITSKLVDAVFPDYHNIFVKQSNSMLEVLSDRLKQALKRAAIISHEKSRIVKFVLIDNVLKIIAKNFENEISEETLDVIYTGTNMEISFNVSYLLDVLNVINTKIVRFLFTNASSSVQLEGVTKCYDETYIVMPIRT